MNSNLSVVLRPDHPPAAYWRPLAIAGMLTLVLGSLAWIEGRLVGGNARSSSRDTIASGAAQSTSAAAETDNCATDSAACVALGLRLTESNPARAARLFYAACEAGQGTGCNDLGVLYREGSGVPQDPVRAAAYFELGCTQDTAESCNNLGVLEQRGLGTTLDLGRARLSYARACELGSSLGCQNLQSLSTSPNEATRVSTQWLSTPPND